MRLPKGTKIVNQPSKTCDEFTLFVKSELNIHVVREFKFHPKRSWKFDYCIPDKMIAIENEGGTFKQRTYTNKKGKLITTIGGRHNSGTGFLGDMKKYDEATAMGYRLIRVTPETLITTNTIELIKRLCKL